MTAHPTDRDRLRTGAESALECGVFDEDVISAVPALLDLLARWERRSGGHIQVDVDEWCDENDMLHMDLQAAVARAEAAEHRATRAEAQAETRRINAEYWKARIKAVEDVLELHGPAHDEPGQDEADCGPQIIADIRRALDGTVTPPRA